MEKTSIIIATHGRFGEELVKSAEMIIGSTTDVYNVSLLPEKSFEDFMAEVEKILKRLNGKVIALVDLFGGTPSNVLTVLTKKYKYKVITGVNLPMFIELYMQNSTGTVVYDELVTNALENGATNIICTNDQLERED
ncbi:PTS sugar transporter subunit IIA [Candidatus Enterococcus willemsii]|uniref:PTS mannose transporter subunit IIAB n=1 Tax=Candidatus Enterococcus willemsii TaxID=1857215 RepID=A0ABQ6Z182_9ENTE|nr:PTS sugar transporter subunit IIA [Enterococcus sp. CU12B]KAF1305145.1 PTS mannose transporter subunit IIAB [Enterococcus sp. CU12B]